MESFETSWLKVELPLGEVSERPWELRCLDGRGFCAFALRAFNVGEMILTEYPTVWVHGHHPFDDEQLEEIEERVVALPVQEREAFYAMANVFTQEVSAAAGIFMTNCFDMVDSPHGTACAMYLAIARLNHSCYPNAQQTHCPETGAEVLYASRRIEVGDEICDCYIDLRQDRRQRRTALSEIYRFDCGCPACSLPDEECKEEDKRRVRASKLEDYVIAAAESDDLQNAMDIAEEAVKLITKEDNLKWSIRYAAGAHMSAYQIATALEKRSLAKKHLKEAHRLNLLLQGSDTPESRYTADLLKTKK